MTKNFMFIGKKNPHLIWNFELEYEIGWDSFIFLGKKSVLKSYSVSSMATPSTGPYNSQNNCFGTL